MPLLKLCGRTGCSEIVNIGITYCDKHQLEFEKRQKKRHIEYKQQRTDKKEQAFYITNEWIQTRDYTKVKYNGLCLWSYYIDHKIVYCDVVHHIVELKEQWELRLDFDNLIPLSDSVHQRVHKLYEQGKKKEVQEILRQLKLKWEREQRDTN